MMQSNIMNESSSVNQRKMLPIDALALELTYSCNQEICATDKNNCPFKNKLLFPKGKIACRDVNSKDWIIWANNFTAMWNNKYFGEY